MMTKLFFRTVLSALLLLVIATTVAQAHGPVQNFDFEAETGSWADGEGPTGWSLNLGSDDQRGLIESQAFVEQGHNAFRFNRVERGFGSARLEQCLILADAPAIQLSTWAWVEEPHPELATRLRMDFYADENCQEDSANAGNEQIQTDIGLSADRAPAGLWVQLNSETRLASELGEDVQSVRISLRLRDRSDNGDPRDPARIVWFDRVSTEADITFLPSAERTALRELYQATGGEQWAQSLEWMGAEGTECRWQGVFCNAAGDRVERIALPRNRLIGELPESLNVFSHLLAGEGLDLCWNEIIVPEALEALVDQHHLGGDPGHCQGLDLLAIGQDLSGSYFQPDGRNGEGFMLHMLSAGSALLMWANYNDQGDPIWLTAVGRATDRVLQFEDVYHSNAQGGDVVIERVGRVSLAFVADPERADCKSAVMRFHAEGSGFGASDGRELSFLDGLGDCAENQDVLPLLLELEGQWFDPAQSGQGLSLMPLVGNAVLLNWYGYDSHGEQIWQVGAGWPDPDGERILFETLYSVSGGNFNDFLSPDQLSLHFHQPAELQLVDGQWRFNSSWQGQALELALHPIEVGPDLLAATGNRIDLSMAPADLDELYSRSIWSDERLPGQVRFNGQNEVHDLTGLRFRGRSSRMLPKKSYNVRFEQPQALLFGSDRMNLNSMYTDPAMMREDIAFQMFRELGQPASLTRYFDLWINDIYEGTYLHIQRVDERLLELNGLNPEGTLVRDRVRDVMPEINSIFAVDLDEISPEDRLDFVAASFDYRNDPAWESVLELLEWAHVSQPGPAFEAEFEQRIDIDNFIDWVVVHWLVGDTDAWADDYWLYLDHDDPDARWMFIPWDKDLSFGSHYRSGHFTDNNFFAYEYSLGSNGGNSLLVKALATQGIRERMHQRAEILMETHFSPGWFENEVATRKERLADSIGIQPGPTAFDRNASNHHDSGEHLNEQAQAIRDFIDLRYAYIQRQLDGTNGSEDWAEGSIAAGETGPLLLTDATGFTLATVELLSDSGNSTSFVVEVEPAPEHTGIDREWQISVEGGASEVRLALFYRNDISPFWGRGNWWTEGEEAVGRQRELQMSVDGPDGSSQHLQTRINAISNKAVAELALSPGDYRFRLTLP